MVEEFAMRGSGLAEEHIWEAESVRGSTLNLVRILRIRYGDQIIR